MTEKPISFIDILQRFEDEDEASQETIDLILHHYEALGETKLFFPIQASPDDLDINDRTMADKKLYVRQMSLEENNGLPIALIPIFLSQEAFATSQASLYDDLADYVLCPVPLASLILLMNDEIAKQIPNYVFIVHGIDENNQEPTHYTLSVENLALLKVPYLIHITRSHPDFFPKAWQKIDSKQLHQACYEFAENQSAIEKLWLFAIGPLLHIVYQSDKPINAQDIEPLTNQIQTKLHQYNDLLFFKDALSVNIASIQNINPDDSPVQECLNASQSLLYRREIKKGKIGRWFTYRKQLTILVMNEA